jgi:hypothetical protein
MRRVCPVSSGGAICSQILFSGPCRRAVVSWEPQDNYQWPVLDTPLNGPVNAPTVSSQRCPEEDNRLAGFASNDFRQEAKDEASAAEVCYVNYGVTFTMLAPSHVKGAEANLVFQALAQQSQPPSWNFNKYLVDGSGNVVQHFGSDTPPESKVLESAIESVL